MRSISLDPRALICVSEEKFGAPGKYSKRRRSNVAEIIVEVIFISSFLFY